MELCLRVLLGTSAHASCLCLGGARVQTWPCKPRHALLKEVTATFVDLLQSTPTRKLVAGTPEVPVVIFTDAAWENGRASLGAVILDPLSGKKLVLDGLVPQSLVDFWLETVGKQLISQIELYAALCVQSHAFLRGRLSLFFLDNNAALHGLIKSTSPTVTMQRMLAHFYRQDLLDVLPLI